MNPHHPSQRSSVVPQLATHPLERLVEALPELGPPARRRDALREDGGDLAFPRTQEMGTEDARAHQSGQRPHRRGPLLEHAHSTVSTLATRLAPSGPLSRWTTAPKAARTWRSST